MIRKIAATLAAFAVLGAGTALADDMMKKDAMDKDKMEKMDKMDKMDKKAEKKKDAMHRDAMGGGMAHDSMGKHDSMEKQDAMGK